MIKRALVMSGLFVFISGSAPAFEFMDNNYAPLEQEMGSGFLAMINPVDGVYQLRLGMEQWLRGTPLFGEYFLLGLLNDNMGSQYLGLGMTIRVMPASWFIAPFIGGGASANFNVYDWTDKAGAIPKEHVGSYWAVIGEAGMRYSPSFMPLYFEAIGQYNHLPNHSDSSYWLAGLGIGTHL